MLEVLFSLSIISTLIWSTKSILNRGVNRDSLENSKLKTIGGDINFKFK